MYLAVSLLVQTHSAGSSIEVTGQALGMLCHKGSKSPPGALSKELTSHVASSSTMIWIVVSSAEWYMIMYGVLN